MGLAFYSKRIDKSTVLTGLKMVDLIENKHDILKIIVKLLINNEKLFDEKVNSILLLKNQKTI